MWKHTSLSLFFVGCFACGGEELSALLQEPEPDVSEVVPSERVLAIMALVNDPMVTVEELDRGAKLDVRAASNIIARRPFETFAELDAIPYVGEVALVKLFEYAVRHGYLSRYRSPALVEMPVRDDVTYVEEVLRAVLSKARITDAEAVLIRAKLRYDDGDRVLDEEELSLAAFSCRDDVWAIEPYSFAESVVVRIMEAFELEDRLALLVAGIPHDYDENRYLSLFELERARLDLTGSTE